MGPLSCRDPTHREWGMEFGRDTAALRAKPRKDRLENA